MKLGQLNSAIKAADTVKVKFSFGSVAVQKTSLMEALKTNFTGGKAQETGLYLRDDGYLAWEVSHGGIPEE